MTTLFGNRLAALSLAVVTFGAGLTMQSGEAEARYGRKGALIAAGVIGALTVGAIAAQANEPRRHRYVDDGYEAYDDDAPVYRHPRPVHRPVQYIENYRGYLPSEDYGRPRYRHYHGYSETGFAYRGPVCKIRRQQVWDGYGWQVQRVQICR